MKQQTTAKEVIESWDAIKRGLKYSITGRPGAFTSPTGQTITEIRVGDSIAVKTKNGKYIQTKVREIYIPRFPKGTIRSIFEKVERWSGTISGLSSLCLIHMLHLAVPFGTIFATGLAGGAIMHILGELMREAGVNTDQPQNYYDRTASASWQDVQDYRVVVGVGSGMFVSGNDAVPLG